MILRRSPAQALAFWPAVHMMSSALKISCLAMSLPATPAISQRNVAISRRTVSVILLLDVNLVKPFQRHRARSHFDPFDEITRISATLQ
jgi:hypothetical protein